MDDSGRVFATPLDTTLVIECTNTGATDISISDSTSNVLQVLRIFDSGSNTKNELQDSSDSSVTINNLTVKNSNNIDLSNTINRGSPNFQETCSCKLTKSHNTDTIKSLVEDLIE